MDCEKFHDLLDAYIDGALDGEDMRKFMDHADSCDYCREEMRAAELLRDMMKDMDDDIAVPLPAQAAWRNAVRAESKKRRMRGVMKIAYAAAAALVLVIGAGAVMSNMNEKDVQPAEMQPMMMRATVTETEEALIARDGSVPAAGVLTDENGSYTAMKRIACVDCDAALEQLSLLSEEYTGVLSSEDAEGEVICRIELPYEYMGDFLSAASRIGTEIESEIEDSARETAVILIHICEE